MDMVVVRGLDLGWRLVLGRLHPRLDLVGILLDKEGHPHHLGRRGSG